MSVSRKEVLRLHKDDVIVDREGVEYRIICVHPPFVSERKKRAEEVTILRLDEGRAYQVSVETLGNEGYRLA